MFEVGVARAFAALHQLEGDSEEAGHEHGHDYRAEVVVRGDRLADNGMLLDLDVLGAAVTACLTELDSVDLDELPAFAGQETTVERVGEHIWDHVAEQLGQPNGVISMRVTVYESDEAWASVDRSLEAH
jgi:6-pyruvoyltetrahydropterin/6-carboxytetrahydropterin synthase